MNQLKSDNGPLRSEAFRRLKVFLANPGKFCVIVLGKRGTGKRYAIERAFHEMNNNDRKKLCLTKLCFLQAGQLPVTASSLDSLFQQNTAGTLVIEDVEELRPEQQKLLFASLSTTDGRFGIKKKVNIRVVFTSASDVEKLREDENCLLGAFWDRISQLIIELPSYQDEASNILNDFRATWAKMRFEDTDGYKHFAKLPGNATLEKFLEEYAEKFEGGFRDLDKLACMYFNYRILFYGEEKRIAEVKEKQIVQEITKDFIGKSQLHSRSGNELGVFQIRPGFSMADLVGQFKIQVRNWGKRQYGTYARAEKELKLGEGTMKNWTEKKVTTAHQLKYQEQK